MPRSEAAAASRPPIVVPLLGFSDGDDSKAPSHPFDKTDDTIYREKLAVAYMKETGQYDGGQCRLPFYVTSTYFKMTFSRVRNRCSRPGVAGRKYILESLPTNYVVYARTRDNNTRVRVFHPPHDIYSKRR